jgi:hypothetical protein
MGRFALATAAAAALLAPAAMAGADQVVDRYEHVATPWSFVDPCTGTEVAGIGTESGVARATFPAGSEHVRVSAEGVVDLYDGTRGFVGTWTYSLHLSSQIPPDEQGALSGHASGPLAYANGHVAVVAMHLHTVFAKGGAPKHGFDRSACKA